MRAIFSFLLPCLFFTINLANASEPTISIFRKLEKQYHGRLGLYAVNTANHQSIAYHANRRFPLCSTAKLMVVAAILKQSESSPNLLNKRLYFTKNFLIASGYAPITRHHLKSGMTIAQLAQAAIEASDNTAANLLIRQLGGPSAVTKFARSIGDQSFQLNRNEPSLNSATPGDKRDTSTPKAMAKSLKTLLLGKALSHHSRLKLTNWLINSKTGSHQIRAVLPKTWRVGDKTGTGAYGTTNDIAIIWPTINSKRIILAVYFTQDTVAATPNDKLIRLAASYALQRLTSLKITS